MPIAHDGEVLFEQYDNGFKADRAQHLHSGTKSFWWPAVAAMISIWQPAAAAIGCM